MIRSRQPTDANRLSSRYPDVADEWHPCRNMDLTPQDVSYATRKRVWWKCRECGHNWAAMVSNRTRGTGCPACVGAVVTDRNRLSLRSPEIAAQWHPSLNAPLTPDDVSVRSNRVVWWLCPKCGHEWYVHIASRTMGNGCRACAIEKSRKR